jgi:magnesium transporter
MEWHNISDPASAELDRLAERYQLHPLHIEDCRHRNQSAKIEEGQTYLFTVMKVVRFDPQGEMEIADLDIFLGPDYLVTVVETECPETEGLIERVRKATAGNGRADQVYYRLVDEIVDSYLPILDRLSESLDHLEDEALASPSPQTLSTIFETKRSLILLRRVMVNTRDVATHLQRTESPLIAKDMWPFLRDVYDHVARNLDTTEVLRDLLNGSLDVYLSSVANRTNQVMKVLTVVGTIALPTLAVSGIYGMNVKGLPGAESPHGLAAVFTIIVATTAFLLWILKRFGWF